MKTQTQVDRSRSASKEAPERRSMAADKANPLSVDTGAVKNEGAAFNPFAATSNRSARRSKRSDKGEEN